MKTLKFMLAAATAIGLASAAQASQSNSTGFEALAVGTNVTTGVIEDGASYSYFYYAGAHAEDNESVIATGTPDIARPRGASTADAGREKILQVSTGTDPLLRTYAALNGSVPQEATELTGAVYVDTLVQFTVTPYTDTVTPNAADKLMIYLKESATTNEFGEVTSTSTNLVVVGGFYAGNATTPREYVLDIGASHMKVEPNTWHRLTVKAIVDISAGLGASALQMPGFAIWVDGEECTLDYYTMDENDQMAALIMAGNQDVYAKKQVLSLLTGSGMQPATLQGVGFAGEGKVDDIVFSELDPFATVFDFTFTAWDSSKVSAIAYTVGGTSYTQAGTYEVEAGTEVQITSITYGDAWLAGTIDAVNMSDPVAGVYTVTNAGASLTINPEVFFPRTSTADQDGTADHPYEVADAAALSALQKGVLAGKSLTGVNFVQTGNIDMTGVTDFYGIGWFKSSDSYASLPPGLASASTDLPFTGVYDGGGYTISNVTLVRHNYAGLFNNVSGTVKNLTVQNLGFATTEAGEWGCAIVGNAQGSALLENLTSAGTVWGNNANHNVAGTVVRVQNTVTIRGCVNNAPITSVSRRLGGIVSFTGNTAPTGTITIEGCTNNAALTVNTGSNAGDRGVGGIISRPESIADGLLIRNCANFGTLTNNGVPAKVGGIAGELNSQNYVDGGGNTFLASLGPVGNYNSKTVTGLTYAKASGDYLTTVAAADLAANEQYTLLANVAASETPVFTLAADGDFISFLLGSYTFAGTVNGAEGLDVTDATESGVLTYTAATSAPTGEELEPGEQSSTTYDSQAAAEAAAAQVTIAASDAVTNALDSAAQATYLANFEAKVVSAGEGQYKVEIGLTAAAETALQAQVNADAAEVIEDLDTANVTLTTTPGFYYSFEYGTALDNMTEGARTLATGSTLTLPRPTSSGATSGFYKVLVNVAPAAVTP